MSVDRFQALSDDQLDVIDAACSRLENSWKFGKPISIEQVCDDEAAENLVSKDTAPAVRECLLRELVAAEIELRRARGEQPDIDEYRSVFPTRRR